MSFWLETSSMQIMRPCIQNRSYAKVTHEDTYKRKTLQVFRLWQNLCTYQFNERSQKYAWGGKDIHLFDLPTQVWNRSFIESPPNCSHPEKIIFLWTMWKIIFIFLILKESYGSSYWRKAFCVLKMRLDVCRQKQASHTDLKFVATVTTGGRVNFFQLCKYFQKTTHFSAKLAWKFEIHSIIW